MNQNNINFVFISNYFFEFVKSSDKSVFPKNTRPYLSIRIENQENLFHVIPLKSLDSHEEGLEILDFYGSMLLRAGQFKVIDKIENVRNSFYLLQNSQQIISQSKRYIANHFGKKVNYAVNQKGLLSKLDDYSGYKKSLVSIDKRYLSDFTNFQKETKSKKVNAEKINIKKDLVSEKQEIYKEIKESIIDTENDYESN